MSLMNPNVSPSANPADLKEELPEVLLYGCGPLIALGAFIFGTLVEKYGNLASRSFITADLFPLFLGAFCVLFGFGFGTYAIFRVRRKK